VQRSVVGSGLVLAGIGAWLVNPQGATIVGLFVIALAMGYVLCQAALGFTGSYRRMIVHRDVAGVQAQVAMLALATVLFAPVLAQGSAFGHAVGGAVAPVGMQVAVGAFVFGIGMQLGNGCGSGTLFTLGGGSTRMVATLAAFVTGSFWASLDMEWWAGTPRLPAIVLGEAVGWAPAVVLQLAVLLGLYLFFRRWGRVAVPQTAVPRGFLTGAWPILWGAAALALLNWLTLLVSGHPWSITWGFTLAGAKLALLAGWDPAGVWFWTGGFTEQPLNGSVLADDTFVMDAGIVLGALIAAGCAGRFAPALYVSPRSLAAAVIGGLMMGYGARIAYGCNIGAFFSGVASTSLHGWLWIALALPGTWLGIQLRPLFGLPN
jgi:uncharacterized membrane protein YedE/YeeE